MANVIGLAGLGVGVFALICSILACALPYWTMIDATDSNNGLWTWCNGQTDECDDVLDLLEADQDDEKATDLKATRAMVLLGLLFILAGVIPVALLLFVMKDKKILGFIGGGVLIAGGLFLMIGMAIYVDKLYDDDDDGATELGAGFAFDIIGWIAAWVAGGLAIFAAIKGGGE